MNKILNFAEANQDDEYDEGITINPVMGEDDIFFEIKEVETGNIIYLTVYQIETMCSLSREIYCGLMNSANKSIN